MNIRHISLAAGTTLALVASGAVSAQEAEPDTWMQMTHSVPRAVVEAETLSALSADRLAGIRPAQEAGSDSWMQVASTKTRAQVRAEVIEARRTGELERIHAEAASFEPVPRATILARGDR